MISQEEAIRKSAVLIESLPYIRQFRGRLVVVKFGGAAMESPEILDQVLRDVVYMESVGMRPVLAHGGGPAISAAMKARGKQPVFVKGRRVTDEETLAIARDVLVNQINADICERLSRLGGHPEPVSNGADAALIGRKVLFKVRNAQGVEEEVDLGLVGEVTAVDTQRFWELTMRGIIPVVAPLATNPAGGALNINADTAAGFLAGALRAEKVVFLSDTHGILRDPKDKESLAPTLTGAEIRAMIAAGAIDGGMLPKVEACLAALAGGVSKAHIVDGRIKHSLLLEIFTDQGIGTEIVA
ncbi:MAG TPA: acetylglutamate kinase [Candidatus Brocadiia bacterium]|nr:acetylglutamate kinase [Candidatus Brocadiia bacterium]